MTTTETLPPAPLDRETPTGLRPLRWWRESGRPPRVMGLDVARALAVLGMVGAHIGVTESFDWGDPATWLDLVHGRSSILFAVLAGISISLMTARGALPEPERMPAIRLNLLGRGAAIFTIGVLLELLGTPIAVILTVYGILYVVAIPFLRWSAPRLFIASAVLALAGPVLLAGLKAISLGAYGPGLGLAVFGTYPITVWLAFVLAGMAIGRMRLLRLRTAVALLVAGVLVSAAGYGLGALGVGIGATSGTIDSMSMTAEDSSTMGGDEVTTGVPPEEIDFTGMLCDDYGDAYVNCYGKTPSGSTGEESEEGWPGYPKRLAEQEPGTQLAIAFFGVSPHSGGTAEILGSGGFAVAVIALCLLLSRPLRWVLLPLAALGSMPLTAYSAHILAIVLIAGPGGFLIGNGEWAWFSIVLVVGATLWAMFLGRGPLERLVGRAAKAMASVPARRSGDVPKVDA